MRIVPIDLNNINPTLYTDTIIRQGEDNATRLDITLSDDFIGHTIKLKVQLNSFAPIITDALTPTNNVVTYLISDTFTQYYGTLKIAVQAYDTDFLIKSEVLAFNVIKSITDGTTGGASDNTEYTYMLNHYMDKDIYEPQLTSLVNTDTALDGRVDVLETTTAMHNVYSEGYIHNGNTAETIPTGTSYTKLTTKLTPVRLSNMTFDNVNNRTIINVSGLYEIRFSFASTISVNNVVMHTSIFKNGVEVQTMHTVRKFGTTGDISTGGGGGFLTCNANDYIEFKAYHEGASSIQLTLKYGNFTMRKISD